MARTVLRNSPNELLVQFDGNLRIAGNGIARAYGRQSLNQKSKFGAGSFYTNQDPITISPPDYGQKDVPDSGWVRFDDTHPNIYYVDWNAWTGTTSSVMYNNTYHYSSNQPSVLQFNFTGTKLRIIAVLGTGLAGSIYVRIDGVNYYFTTKLVSGGTRYKRVVFEVTDLEPGEHALTLQRQGDSNPFYFDAVDLEQGNTLLPYKSFSSLIQPRAFIESPIIDLSKDFTVNYWEYCTSSSPWTDRFRFNSAVSGRNSPLVMYNNGTNNVIRMSTGSTTGTGYGDIALDLTCGAITLNSWVNWEISRSGNTYRVFMNGVLQRTFTSSLVPQTTNSMGINLNDWFAGVCYIDELYFISGTCLHTANFTPETEPAYVDWSPIEIEGINIGDMDLGERASISVPGLLIDDNFTGAKSKNYLGKHLENLPGIKSRNHSGNELPMLGNGIRSRNHKAAHLPIPEHATRMSAIFSGRELPIIERSAKSRNHNGISLDETIPSIRLPHNFDGIPIEITPTSNAENKFNLTVTPTHLHKLPSVVITCESKSPLPLLGKCSLKIGNNDIITLNEDYEDVRYVNFTVTPSVLSTGNNLCRISYEYPDGEVEHLDFEIFKEEPKRLQVERLFRHYEGGYDGERQNAIQRFSGVYPGFMVPEGQPSTLITTTQFTRIDLRKYLSIQGVNIDAKGARILVSFDEGITWKTWGIVGRGALNTSKSIIPVLSMDNTVDYVANASSRTGSNAWQPYRVFDGLTNAAGGSNFWLASSGVFPHWVSIQMSKKRRVNGYTMVGYYQPERNPKAWRLEGSNNGTAWDILDSRSGQTLSLTVKSYYSFENTNEYLYYRIVVTELYGGPTASCVIVEMDLFELEPIYGWKDVDISNITDDGMSEYSLNSRTIAEWADVFKPKSIDFAIYLDNRLSNYYDLSIYPLETVGILSYWGFNASFQIYKIPDEKIVTTTFISRWNNYAAGTYGRAIYADYTQTLATPGVNSNRFEVPITISKDVKYITLETPNTNGTSYAVGAQYDCSGTNRIAYLKSINVQITPNLKTGYAFII